MTSKLYYLNTNMPQPCLQVIEQLPKNAIHTIVYEVDEQIFPLKTTEETTRYLLTYYQDPMHTKLLPGFQTHRYP